MPTMFTAGVVPPPAPVPPPMAPTTPTPLRPPGSPAPGTGEGWLSDVITGAVESFFRALLTHALAPLMDAVGSALLSTPAPSELPALVGLWEGSRALAVSLYGLLVLAGGLVVMGHQTVQTRYALREIAPRVLVGFLASMFSLAIAEQATAFSNALSAAILGDAVSVDSAAEAMTQMVTGGVSGSAGLWVIVVALCIPILLVLLLITFVMRVGLAAILLVAGPLLLIFHALPQTDGVARWWWRAYAAVLAAQVGQSLTLAVGVRVILTPDGLVLAEDAGQAWLGILLLISLLAIMIKIPFWMIAAARIGGPSLIRIAGRALQIYAGLRGLGAAGAAAGRRPARRGRGWRGRPGPSGPARPGPGRGPRGPRGGPTGPVGSPLRPRGGPRPLGPRSAGGAAVPEPTALVVPTTGPGQGSAGVVPVRHGRYQLAPRPHTPPAQPPVQPGTRPRPPISAAAPAPAATATAANRMADLAVAREHPIVAVRGAGQREPVEIAPRSPAIRTTPSPSARPLPRRTAPPAATPRAPRPALPAAASRTAPRPGSGTVPPDAQRPAPRRPAPRPQPRPTGRAASPTRTPSASAAPRPAPTAAGVSGMRPPAGDRQARQGRSAGRRRAVRPAGPPTRTQPSRRQP